MDDPPKLTPSQIDKLGERLRSGGTPTDRDLDMLERYQKSLQRPYGEAVLAMELACADAIPHFQWTWTGRIKQLRSIVAKLERHGTKLSSMQDLLGFRVILVRAVDQEMLTQRLAIDSDWKVIDRRKSPSHGYRAVHAVWKRGRVYIEAQIRTELQQFWADWSEHVDRLNPGVKYGEGDETTLVPLRRVSELIAGLEDLEVSAVIDPIPGWPDETHRQKLADLRENLRSQLMEIVAGFQRMDQT